MYSTPDHLRFLERQLAAQQKHGLLTNSIVRIAGRQHPSVNGKPLKLTLHAFTVLLLLAARAIESPGDFFSTEDIVKEIETRGDLLGELELSWQKPTGGEVHSAVSALRKTLAKQRLNRNLIESVPGKGYRLSTPAMNIVTDALATKKLGMLSLGSFRNRNGNEPKKNGAVFARQ